MTSILRRIFGRDDEGDDREHPIRLVFALGNPGPEYAGNRRNVGFWVADRLAKKHGLTFSRKTGTYALAEGEIGGRRVAIAKTRTFNNDSGKAVMALINTLRLDDARELLVVSDHLDLPPGKVRIRRKGGSGGQKGIADIIARTRTDGFPRVRIGIGRPVVDGEPSWDPEHVAAWVLSDPEGEERAVLEAAVERAVEAIECAITEGVDAAMNRYNRDAGAPGAQTQPQAAPDERDEE
jgi:PTH1 family peptidyl-tRNA hydrolase